MSSNIPNQPVPVSQDFIVRVPKNLKKKYNVMRFHASLKMDVAKWSQMQVKMDRENNVRDFKAEEELPKFGAGSEYGREQREEARRKKYGITLKKYNPDDQPWILKTGGKTGKKFRGVREGGIASNASYYVFVKAPDGAFEAYPVEEWYNFTQTTTYKTLNAEEAEEEFGKRDTVLNYFSIMRKRLKNGEEEEKEEDGEKSKKKKKGEKYGTGGGDLKISDMDEWVRSSEEESEEEGAVEKTEVKKNPKKPTKAAKGKKKKKSDSDDEIEESDDGDDEGREVDYISDESSSEDEAPEDSTKSLKGVEDEEAIRKMEESESEEENAEDKKDNPDEAKEESPTAKSTKEKKESKKNASSSESSSDTSDSDDFDNDTTFQSALFVSKSKRKEGNSSRNSRSNTPTGGDSKKDSKGKAQKRKHASAATKEDETASPPVKKSKAQIIAQNSLQSEASSSSSASSRPFVDLSSEGITEECVKRYLMRKPMTTTELLHKFKSKKTKVPPAQLVQTIAQILKRLNPIQTKIKGKLHLSLKRS